MKVNWSVMFRETIAAILLITASFPIWATIAVIWGLISAFLTFAWTLINWLSQPQVEWDEAWLIPVSAIFEGLASAWSVPAEIWIWAKFQHPWWATVIGLALFSLLGGGSRAR